MGHAGVVDDDVRRAEALHAQVGQGLHVFGARDITAQGRDLRASLLAGGAELGHGLIQRVLLHVGDDEVEALLGRQARELQAEAAGRAGDDGRQARFQSQVGHGWVPMK